jgi:hypothetical protein
MDVNDDFNGRASPGIKRNTWPTTRDTDGNFKQRISQSRPDRPSHEIVLEPHFTTARLSS